MKSTKQLLGARVKEIRKGKGLSQSELSEKLEIATNFLSRIEVGASYPSIDTLERMSVVLEVDLKDFFDFEHLQVCSEDVATIQLLLAGASEEKCRLAYKIIKAIVK